MLVAFELNIADRNRGARHVLQLLSPHHCLTDYLTIACANKDEPFFDQFAAAYGKRFESKISACVDKFIGLKITRDRKARSLTLSQELYIEKTADCFLPIKTLRKTTTTPAWFTDKAQRVSTFSKLGITTTKSDSAGKH
eukprot:6172647-Pleurochrysis_carterae.AAC.1